MLQGLILDYREKQVQMVTLKLSIWKRLRQESNKTLDGDKRKYYRLDLTGLPIQGKTF